MTMDYESKAPAEIWATVNAAGFVHIMDDRQQAEDTAEDWNNLADEGYTEHAGTRVICYVPARSSGHRPAGDEAAPIGLRAHLDAAFSLASIAAEPDIMDCIGNAIAIMDGDPDPHGDTESQSVARETSTVDGVIYAQHPGSTGDANYRNDGSTAAQTTECKSMGQKATEHGYLRDATLDDFREATRRIARWSGFFYEADYAWEAPHPLHLAELLESSTAPHDAKDTERRSVALASDASLIDELNRRGWVLHEHHVPVGYDGDEHITVRRLEHRHDPRTNDDGSRQQWESELEYHTAIRDWCAAVSDTECRSAFVADVSRQLRNALAVGSWDMVEQLLADIEPTDCGSVGGEDGE